jgi:hypothetical protein
MGVDGAEQFDGTLCAGRWQTANEHTIGRLEIANRRAFGEELGVREDVELDARLRVGLEHRSNALRSQHGHGGLFYDDRALLRVLGDRTSDALVRRQIITTTSLFFANHATTDAQRQTKKPKFMAQQPKSRKIEK